MRSRSLLPVVLPLALGGPTLAQLQPGEMLFNGYAPGKLVHMLSDGTVILETSGGQGNEWEGAGVLPDGRWVTTRRTDFPGVNLFDPVSGTQVGGFDLPISYPGDVGALADGTIVVAGQSSGLVLFYDDLGNLLHQTFIPSSVSLFGLDVDFANEVWVGDSYGMQVIHLDAAGNVLGSFATGHVMGDLERADDGTLWMTNRDTGEVMHYASDGTPLGSFPTPLAASTFYTLAIDLDGTLWVADFFSQDLLHYDPAGTSLGSTPIPSAGSALFLTIGRESGGPIGDSYCGPASLNSTGMSASITAFGYGVAGGLPLELRAAQLPPGEPGYFLNSETPGFVPFVGGSQGHLCLGGSIGRFVQQVQVADAAGTFAIDVDTLALPQPGGTVAIQSGETWRFQAWFRDKNPGATSNLTDGVEILFH